MHPPPHQLPWILIVVLVEAGISIQGCPVGSLLIGVKIFIFHKTPHDFGSKDLLKCIFWVLLFVGCCHYVLHRNFIIMNLKWNQRCQSRKWCLFWMSMNCIKHVLLGFFILEQDCTMETGDGVQRGRYWFQQAVSYVNSTSNLNPP